MRRRLHPAPRSDLEAVIIRSPNGRCGTTLLMQLLATSEEIAFDRVMPYEHRYLAYLLHATAPMGAAHTDTETWNLDAMLSGATRELGPLPFDATSLDVGTFAPRALRGLWDAFGASLRGTPRYYAEKYGHGLERLHQAGIGVREIWVIRDPRDVFASIRAFDAKRGYYGFGREPGETEGAYLERFIAGVKAYADEMPPDARLVRYEDMVADLDAVARQLGEWLGVTLKAGAVHRRQLLRRGHMTSPNPEASVGRWRTDLTEAEAARIAAMMPAQLQRFAYQ